MEEQVDPGAEDTATRHWVEQLFPPAFGLDIHDIQDEKEPEEPPLNVFDDLARKKISQFDTLTIKNVYERVWLMNTLEKEEIERRQIQDTMASKGSLKLTGTFTRHSLAHSGTLEDENRSLHDLDLNDSCIWSSKEIDVLREVFKAARTQNNKLKAVLQVTSERAQDLESKHKKSSRILELKTVQLQETKKANSRLQIMCEKVKRELDKTNAQITFLHEELKHSRASEVRLNKEVHAVQLELDMERIERKKAEADAENAHRVALQDFMQREEQMKYLHNEDITYMRKQMKELEEELAKEREDHQRSKRGLDHLRTHFASLAIHGEHIAENVVTHNEVTKLAY